MALLLLEDDPQISSHLGQGLEQAGFEVKRTAAGDEALLQALTHPFEALIVDVQVPGMSGFEVVSRLRGAGHDTPVLFLTARTRIEDRVHGLKEGGDDYVVKPYSLPEVVARVKSILRRGAPAETSSPQHIEWADVVWEPVLRKITRCGCKIDLTPKEYTLAALLLEHRGTIVSRNQIGEALWGFPQVTDPNAVDVYVRRLRRKLDEPFPTKLIHTLRGLGVMLEAQ